RGGEDAGGGGLADGGEGGQDAGLRDASSLERIRDRAHHRILADQIIEGRGTILASEHAVGRIVRRPIVEDESRLGLVRGVAHNAIRSAAPTRGFALHMREGWGAGEPPGPVGLGPSPSGPGPGGGGPPPPPPSRLYIGGTQRECKRRPTAVHRRFSLVPSSCACLLEKPRDGREGFVALVEYAGKEIEAVRHAFANEVLDRFAPRRAQFRRAGAPLIHN